MTRSLPTTGMLFSAWHATMHALQPVQRERSIDSPHLCPEYCTGSWKLSGAPRCSASSSEVSLSFASVVTAAISRPSIEWCSCVCAICVRVPVGVTVSPAANQGASLWRSVAVSKPRPLHSSSPAPLRP